MKQEEEELHTLALLSRTWAYIQTSTETTLPQKLKKLAAHLQNELLSTSPSSSQSAVRKLGNTIVAHYGKKHKCICACIFWIYCTILSRRKAFDHSFFFPALIRTQNSQADHELGIHCASRHLKSKLSHFLQTPGLCKLVIHKTWNTVLHMNKGAAPSQIFLKSPSPWRRIINSLTTRAGLYFIHDALRQKRQKCSAGCSSSFRTSLRVAGGEKRSFSAGTSYRQAQKDFSFVLANGSFTASTPEQQAALLFYKKTFPVLEMLPVVSSPPSHNFKEVTESKKPLLEDNCDIWSFEQGGEKEDRKTQVPQN